MAQRVFLVWIHPLFLESVRLLLDNPEVELVGTASDYAGAKEDISRLQPDTILIERSGGSTPGRLMELLDSCSWSVRVVGLSLEDNELSVYHHKKQTVGHAEDLLRLIQGDSF